jgi:hypothetical protein
MCSMVLSIQKLLKIELNILEVKPKHKKKRKTESFQLKHKSTNPDESGLHK